MFLLKLQIISGIAILILTSIFVSISISKNEESRGLLSNQANETTLVPYTVRGASMEPTLKDGERIFVDANYYKSYELKRGDIAAFKFKTREQPFVKRVIAVAGDKLEFGKDGNIYLNGEKLEEPYLPDDYHFNLSKIRVLLIPLNQTNNTVPEGTSLVLGDNRRSSFDSGDYGFVPVEYVIGKVI